LQTVAVNLIVAVDHMEFKWQSICWTAYQLGQCSHAWWSWPADVYYLDQR